MLHRGRPVFVFLLASGSCCPLLQLLWLLRLPGLAGGPQQRPEGRLQQPFNSAPQQLRCAADGAAEALERQQDDPHYCAHQRDDHQEGHCDEHLYTQQHELKHETGPGVLIHVLTTWQRGP